MFEFIEILFWKRDWDYTLLYDIKNESSNGTHIEHKIIPTCKTSTGDNYADGILIGIENHGDRIDIEAIERIIKNIDEKKIRGIYIQVQNRNHAVKLAENISLFNSGEVSIYGINENYYSSIISLNGNHRKIMEKYILSLRMNFTLWGRVKNIILNLLITIDCSYALYERYIVTVNKAPGVDNVK